MVPKALPDVVRYVLILAATSYATFLIGQWHWIVAVLACVPVYIVALNLFGFLTLPLYLLTPEVRQARDMKRALLQKLRGQVK
jgi:hypothetical protein